MLSHEYTLIRPASMRSPSASMSSMRSTSSASPPAVGNTITGRPKWPHRTTVTSLSRRREYQRSRLFMRAESGASGVEQALLAREQPAEAVTEMVAPPRPCVTVEGFHHLDLRRHATEHVDHGEVALGRRLERAVAEKDLFHRQVRLRADGVDEADHGVERGAALVLPAHHRVEERRRLQQQAAVEARRPPGRRERRDGPEARPGENPAGRLSAQGQPLLEQRHKLGGEEAAVRGTGAVLAQPLAGMGERDHAAGHCALVHEVVENRPEGRVLEVVTAVVHHEQGEAMLAAHPRRRVHRHVGLAAQSLAVETEFGELAGHHRGVRQRPRWRRVALGAQNGHRARRTGGRLGVEWVEDVVDAIAVADQEPVLDARARRQLDGGIPEVAAPQPLQRQWRGEAADGVLHGDPVGVAAEEEGAGDPLDERDAVLSEELVDGCDPHPVGAQLGERATPGRVRRGGGHAAVAADRTTPSGPTTRALLRSAGPPSTTAMRSPSSSSTQTRGASRRARRARWLRSSMRSRLAEAGSGTTPRTRPMPAPYTSSGTPPRSWSSTIMTRSAIAIAPDDHATTGTSARAAPRLHTCRQSVSTPTWPPAMATAEHCATIEATASRWETIAARSCGG